MATKIQLRRDTATNWTSNDPTLAVGEVGFETDTGKIKIGNGSLQWSNLGYFTGDLSSLAAVATSGDYDDLDNKPTIPAQFNPIAGSNVTLSGTYPNITFNASGGGGGGGVQLLKVLIHITDGENFEVTNPLWANVPSGKIITNSDTNNTVSFYETNGTTTLSPITPLTTPLAGGAIVAITNQVLWTGLMAGGLGAIPNFIMLPDGWETTDGFDDFAGGYLIDIADDNIKFSSDTDISNITDNPGWPPYSLRTIVNGINNKLGAVGGGVDVQQVYLDIDRAPAVSPMYESIPSGTKIFIKRNGSDGGDPADAEAGFYETDGTDTLVLLKDGTLTKDTMVFSRQSATDFDDIMNNIFRSGISTILPEGFVIGTPWGDSDGYDIYTGDMNVVTSVDLPNLGEDVLTNLSSILPKIDARVLPEITPEVETGTFIPKLVDGVLTWVEEV